MRGPPPPSIFRSYCELLEMESREVFSQGHCYMWTEILVMSYMRKGNILHEGLESKIMFEKSTFFPTYVFKADKSTLLGNLGGFWSCCYFKL